MFSHKRAPIWDALEAWGVEEHALDLIASWGSFEVKECSLEELLFDSS